MRDMKQIYKFILCIVFSILLTTAALATPSSDLNGNIDLTGKRYVQSTLQVFGYDYIPSEGFAFSDPTTSSPPYVEFTDSENGTAYLWNTFSDYYVDFTYTVDDGTITLCAANHDTFGGTEKIVMEYDSYNDSLEVVDLNMPSDRVLGWTACNDIFTYHSSVTATVVEEEEQAKAETEAKKQAETEQQSADTTGDDTPIWSAVVTFENTLETEAETITIPEDFDVTFETIESMPGYKGIRTPEQLDAVRYDLSGKYILLNDIDMAEWGNWEPIGKRALPFTGIFDGNSYVISSLKINREEEYQNDGDSIYVGFFGVIENSELRNITLTSCEYCIKANRIHMGGIAAEVGGKSHIYNCFFNGNMKSNCLDYYLTVGGISGNLASGSMIEYCGTSGSIEVNGGLDPYIGGIAGHVSGMQADSGDIKSYIRYSKSECDIISYSATNNSCIGGIAGDVSIGEIHDCYYIGVISVSDDAYAGGIVGVLNGAIRNCYSIGSIVSVDRYDGSTVDENGYNYPSWFKLHSGFVGFRKNSFAEDKTIENCYMQEELYTDMIGRDELHTDHYAICALSDTDMKFATSYENWDFDSVWMIDPTVNDGYPVLRQPVMEQVVIEPPLDIAKIVFVSLIILGSGMIVVSAAQLILNPVKNKTKFAD